MSDTEQYESNIDVAKEDQAQADSEATGRISKEEVDALKDDLGGGEVLDDSEGHTRAANKDAHPMQAEEAVDKAVDELE